MMATRITIASRMRDHSFHHAFIRNDTVAEKEQRSNVDRQEASRSPVVRMYPPLDMS
jgi:hypothetical protein